MKIGRNDPCPCGSGKKFKKCCMRMQATKEREARQLGAGREWVNFYTRELVTSLVSELDQHTALIALKADWPSKSDEASSWQGDDQLLQHALLDVSIAGGKPLISLGPARTAAQVSQEELEALAGSLSESHPSLWEVMECKRGKGIRLKDRLTQESHFINDSDLSEKLEPMEVILGRLVFWQEKPVLLDGWEKLYFRGRKAVIRDIEEQLLSDGLENDDAEARVIWLRRRARDVVRKAREARLR